MTGIIVHQCPKCELRFSFRSELEYHLNVDHPPPAAPHASAENIHAARAPDPLPAASAAAQPVATIRRRSSGSLRLAGLVCAIAAVFLVAYAAVSVSISTAVVIAALLLALGAICARRARSRIRLPRR